MKGRTMQGYRTKIAVGTGAVGVVLGAASLAWACTAQLGFGIQPGGGLAGTPVTASGESAPGPVDLHWNGVDGPVVAKATVPESGTFVVGFTVPDVAPGVYTVVALSRGGDGTVLKSEAPFQVSPNQASTGPSAQTVAADLWSGFASGDKVPASGPSNVTGSSATDASQLTLGVGLLGGGLALLGAGFAAAEARRRKAMATQSAASR